MMYTSVIECIVRLFGKIRPVCLKRLFLSWMLSFLSFVFRLKSMVSQLRLPVILVSGVEKQTGKDLCLLFVGGKSFPAFLKDLMFREMPIVEQKGWVFVWKIKDIKKKYCCEVDAVLVSCDQFYQQFLHKDDFFVFPHMVDMVFDHSEEFTELSNRFSRNTKRDIKKMEERMFSYEITSDVEKLKMFYIDMFLPTLSKRIGKRDTFTPDFMFMRYLMEMGYELMMITEDGNYACGGFFYQNKDNTYLKYSGVLEGKISLIEKRASTAIYYFFIRESLKRKVKKIVFGGVRPFFYDGLFQYKGKWGMKVEPYSLIPKVIGLSIVNENEAMKQFLINNPFISINEKDEFVGLVFVDEDMDKEKVEKKAEKRFNISGVEGFQFVRVKSH